MWKKGFRSGLHRRACCGGPERSGPEPSQPQGVPAPRGPSPGGQGCQAELGLPSQQTASPARTSRWSPGCPRCVMGRKAVMITEGRSPSRPRGGGARLAGRRREQHPSSRRKALLRPRCRASASRQPVGSPRRGPGFKPRRQTEPPASAGRVLSTVLLMRKKCPQEIRDLPLWVLGQAGAAKGPARSVHQTADLLQTRNSFLDYF